MPKFVRVRPEPMQRIVSEAPSHLNTPFGAVLFAEPSASGMVVRERALALHGGDDRNLRQFRQRAQFFGRFGVEDALSGPDHRIAGVEQRLHRVSGVGAVGRGFHGLRRSVIEGVLRHLLPQNVAVEFDHRRSRPTVFRRVERAADLPRRQVYPVDGKRHLGHRLVAPGGGEIRLHVVTAQACAAGEEHEGNTLAPGLGDAAKRVLYTGPTLRCEHADTLAGRLSAEAIGRVDAASLLPEYDGPDTDLGDRLDERVGGKARHPGHAFRFQAARDQIETVHSPPRSMVERRKVSMEQLGATRWLSICRRGGPVAWLEAAPPPDPAIYASGP